jgi:rubrerythrin
VAVTCGDVGTHGVQRGLSTSASEETSQKEREPRAPSERLKRAPHRVYYTIQRDMAQDAPVHRCWVCGAIMREIKCKIVCPNCGYTRDCSDP